MNDIFVENIDNTDKISIEPGSAVQYTIVVESVEEESIVAELDVNGPSSIVVDYTPGTEYSIVIENAIRSVEELGLPAPSSDGQILASLMDGTLYWTDQYVHPNYAPISEDAIMGQVIDTIVADDTGHLTEVSLRYLQAGDIPNLAISKITGLQTELDNRYTETELQGDGTAQVHWNNLTDIPGTITGSHLDLTDIGTNTHAQIDAYIAVGHIPLSQKGAANGVATLGADGKIPSAQLSALAITETFVVANEAAQLALSAEEGDVAVRTDENKSYIHNGGVSGTMADWQELLTPTDAVLSVNGYTGTVSLDTDDIPEGSTNLYSQWVTTASNIYYDTGNVGIGTDDPKVDLHIQGSALASIGYNAETLLLLENDGSSTMQMLSASGSSCYIRMGHDTSYYQGMIIYLNSSNEMRFYTNTSVAMTIDSSQVANFTNFPTTPVGAPTTNYQVANKKYVDDNAGDVFWGSLINQGEPLIVGVNGDDTVREEASLLWYDTAGYLAVATQMLIYNDKILRGGSEATTAITLGSNVTYTTNHLLDVVNNASVKFYVDKDGNAYANGTLLTGGAGISFGTDNQVPFTNVSGDDFDYDSDFRFDGNQLTIGTGTTYVALLANSAIISSAISATQGVYFNPGVSDGATAKAFLLNSTNALSTAGAKLLTIQNNSVEKFYIDKDGNAYAGGTLLTGGSAPTNYLRDDASDETTGTLTAANFTTSGHVETDVIIPKSNTQLVLNAGESDAYATGQTGEVIYLNAEGGLQINSSPDNWSSGWAGRNTAVICNVSGVSSLPGNLGIITSTILTPLHVQGEGDIQIWETDLDTVADANRLLMYGSSGKFSFIGADDGGSISYGTTMLTFDMQNEFIGLFNDSPSYHLDLTGQARFTMGRRNTGYIHSNSVTQNTIFDTMVSALPTDTDELMVTGAIWNGATLITLSKATKNSSTTIVLYGIAANGTAISLVMTDGDATVYKASFTW